MCCLVSYWQSSCFCEIIMRLSCILCARRFVVGCVEFDWVVGWVGLCVQSFHFAMGWVGFGWRNWTNGQLWLSPICSACSRCFDACTQKCGVALRAVLCAHVHDGDNDESTIYCDCVQIATDASGVTGVLRARGGADAVNMGVRT